MSTSLHKIQMWLETNPSYISVCVIYNSHKIKPRNCGGVEKLICMIIWNLCNIEKISYIISYDLKTH